jgi:hypothetical protein
MLVAKIQGMEPPKNKIADTDTTATTYLDAVGSEATITLGMNISPNTIAQALDTIRCSGRPISESRYVNGIKIRPKILKKQVFFTRIELKVIKKMLISLIMFLVCQLIRN